MSPTPTPAPAPTPTQPPAPARLRPTTLVEAREAMVEAAGVVAVTGAGTKAGWGPAGRLPDLVVETTGLDRLVAHNHGDLTAVVEAGLPLARLQEHLAGAGQWLALDPASEARGATVGGILAAGDAGPRRHRYGTMRDLVIGATVVLTDGAVARSGGQVIKNVAGYDLAKLLCGSFGTLGLVTEVSVRLHPRPPASTTVVVPAAPGPATALVVALAASPVVPSAVDWADGALWVRIEGPPEGVA
ncbi:MAG: FAD-binding oxidoreductase, partial [Acidimicrobiales bacterium]